jgi:IS5 family transposase
MKILFWGPVTLQKFHFDAKHAKPAKKFFFYRTRAPWRGRKKAHLHIRGIKKIFFQTPS